MTPQDVIRVELAMLAWREAFRHGGVKNMLAVAFVVRNRVNAGWLAGDWMKVIAHHDDYSSAKMVHPEHYTDMEVPDFHHRAVRDLLVEVDFIFDGTRDDDLTEGSLYYCELFNIQNPWFTENITRKPEDHPRVATIGPVSFFR
jgi:hypothetical protein